MALKDIVCGVVFDLAVDVNGMIGGDQGLAAVAIRYDLAKLEDSVSGINRILSIISNLPQIKSFYKHILLI